MIGVPYKEKYKTLISGLIVRLIEGVCLIGGPLNRGFIIFLVLYVNHARVVILPIA